MKTERQKAIGIMVCAAALFIILSATVGGTKPNWSPFLAAIWTIGVPIWFWVEYTFLASEEEKNDSVSFKRLKYSQELASKIWLAVAAVLAALYFK